MKQLLSLLAVMALLFGCSGADRDLLSEISGVWRAKQDGAMVTINHDGNKLMFAIADTVIPATLGAIDDANNTVNFNVNLTTGNPGIWTLKQVWDKEHKTFHLVFTLHDGTQDELAFVRKISTDDLNRFAAVDSSSKTVGASSSDAVNKQVVQSPQAVEPGEIKASSSEQSGICAGLDLTITAEQLECLERKYTAADKELNLLYKQKMASLDDARKASFKKEQIAWIKEKESKCAQAGKEVAGGSYEPVMIKDCLVQMTESRVAYLTAANATAGQVALVKIGPNTKAIVKMSDGFWTADYDDVEGAPDGYVAAFHVMKKVKNPILNTAPLPSGKYFLRMEENGRILEAVAVSDGKAAYLTLRPDMEPF